MINHPLLRLLVLHRHQKVGDVAREHGRRGLRDARLHVGVADAGDVAVLDDLSVRA